MNFLAGEIAAIGFEEGLARERASFGRVITVRFAHALLKDLREEARHTGVFHCSLHSGPMGDCVFEGNGYVAKSRLHSTVSV